MGLSVLRSIKKALAIVPKLSPRIVLIDKSCAVIGYASGQNKQSFMQLIDNGMFNMDETIIVDGLEGSEDDDKVLGSVSKMGMPITREDTVGDIQVEDNQIVTKEWDPFLRGTVIPLFWAYIKILRRHPSDGMTVESYCCGKKGRVEEGTAKN